MDTGYLDAVCSDADNVAAVVRRPEFDIGPGPVILAEHGPFVFDNGGDDLAVAGIFVELDDRYIVHKDAVTGHLVIVDQHRPELHRVVAAEHKLRHRDRVSFPWFAGLAGIRYFEPINKGAAARRPAVPGQVDAKMPVLVMPRQQALGFEIVHDTCDARAGPDANLPGDHLVGRTKAVRFDVPRNDV